MASSISLAELMGQTGQVPYTKSLKVKVICNESEFAYRNDKGEERVLINCAVADWSKAVKCTVYDSTKFQRFREGQSLILRNIIKKPDAVVVTTNTKVFPTTAVEVPEHIVTQARHILNPPPAPTKPVSEALRSPAKVRVSIKGKIVQEEAMRQVFVKENQVKVKNIFLEDATEKCKVALWRDTAEQDIRPGDFVEITDVVVNVFRNETSLTTTSRTKITKLECPPEVATQQAISVCIEGQEVTFLLENDNVLSVPLDVVKATLPDVDNGTIEQHLLERCNPTLSVTTTKKDNRTISIQFL